MMASAEERLATLEAEMKNVRSDVSDIKDSLKALEIIAQRGGGAFHMILLIGGVMGWVAGMGTTLYALFKH